MDNELLKSLVGLGGIPIILALTQLFKPWVKDTRLYPFISIAFGLAINMGLSLGLGNIDRISITKGIFFGLLAGLGASGVYSAGATFKEGSLAIKTRRQDIPPSPPR